MSKNCSLLFFASLLFFTSCEKAVFEERDDVQKTKGNLTVSISHIEQIPFDSFTRSELSEVCERINFVIYDMEGTRVEQVNQKSADDDFGKTTFQLAEGDYQLVALAHSSNGNPTLTNPEKIQFTNAQGFTDTFLCDSLITIGPESLSLSLDLHRIVSLCRFVITDDIPTDVATLRFQYKGGSGAFNASTGLGCVNSIQTVTFDADNLNRQYDLYTFLHETEGTIHLQVTAYDAGENVIHEREFDIPMRKNRITKYSGEFFTDAPPSSNAMTSMVTIDTKWDGEDELNY